MTNQAGHSARRWLAACMIVAAVFAPAHAQHAKPTYGEKILFQDAGSVTAGAGMRSWSIGDGVVIAQQAYPVTVTIPASERMLFSLATVPASVHQGDAAIAGVPETRLSVVAVLPGERILLSGSVSAPTGRTRLSQEQSGIASVLAQPALGYRMPSMGHGVNATLGCAYAMSVARGVVFGFGGAVSFKGNYEPVEPTESFTMRYQPGHEIAANVGVDLRDGMKKNRFSADYTVTYYFADKINGDRFFRSGIRAAFVLVGTHAASIGVHMLQVRADVRARNVNVANGIEEESAAAQQIGITYSLTVPVRERVTLTAAAEARIMSSDEFPVNGRVVTTGGGTIGMLTAEGRYAAAPWCIVSSQLGFGFGTIMFMNSDRHAVGFDAGVGVKFLF